MTSSTTDPTTIGIRNHSSVAGQPEPDSALHFTLPTAPAARVMHQVRTIPEANRTLIRDSLGYSQPTVTRHVSALVDSGLIEQAPASRSTVQAGRPRSNVILDGRHLVAWGLHIGVRSTVLVVSDGAGRVLREKTLSLPIQELSATAALAAAARGMRALGGDLPEPVGVGAAFSTHITDDGHINSDIYRWEDVPVAAILREQLGHPLSFATGVTAMAATELLSHPLALGDEHHTGASTLYFYAREVIAHAWMFHGAVHRPHHGRFPAAFHEIAATGSFLVEQVKEQPHIHPLSNTSVLEAARGRGIGARDFPHLVHLADRNPVAREILNERARLLGEAISLAVDVVDPDTLVFAGEAFTVDQESLRLIVAQLRERQGGPGSLRIQRANRHILRDAAKLVALHRLWQDPLGTLGAHSGS